MTTAVATTTQYDWLVPQSTLVRLQIPVLDGNGAPFNVTGWSVDAKVHTSGGTVLYTWLTGDTLASGTNVTLTILPAESALWTFCSALWRVHIQHPSDATQIYRIIEGKFRVDPA